jgi:hypothetical protein
MAVLLTKFPIVYEIVSGVEPHSEITDIDIAMKIK